MEVLEVEAADLIGRYLAHGQGWWLLGVILELAVLSAVVILAVLVVQRIMDGSLRRPGDGPRGAAPPGDDGALSELRLRYARGEVSREEYLQAAADLGSPAPAGDETRTT